MTRRSTRCSRRTARSSKVARSSRRSGSESVAARARTCSKTTGRRSRRTTPPRTSAWPTRLRLGSRRRVRIRRPTPARCRRPSSCARSVPARSAFGRGVGDARPRAVAGRAIAADAIAAAQRAVSLEPDNWRHHLRLCVRRLGRRAAARRAPDAGVAAGAWPGALARRDRARGAAGVRRGRARAGERNRGTGAQATARSRFGAVGLYWLHGPRAAGRVATRRGALAGVRARTRRSRRQAISTRARAARTRGTRLALSGCGTATSTVRWPRSTRRCAGCRASCSRPLPGPRSRVDPVRHRQWTCRAQGRGAVARRRPSMPRSPHARSTRRCTATTSAPRRSIAGRTRRGASRLRRVADSRGAAAPGLPRTGRVEPGPRTLCEAAQPGSTPNAQRPQFDSCANAGSTVAAHSSAQPIPRPCTRAGSKRTRPTVALT